MPESHGGRACRQRGGEPGWIWNPEPQNETLTEHQEHDLDFLSSLVGIFAVVWGSDKFDDPENTTPVQN